MYKVECVIALRKGAIIYYILYIIHEKYFLSSRMAIMKSSKLL